MTVLEALRNRPNALLALTWFQVIASAAMANFFLIGSIVLVESKGGNRSWSGVPTALILLASSLSIYPLSRIRERRGFRVLLVGGFGVGTAGCLAMAFGVLLRNPSLLLAAFASIGVANGIILFSRFAAVEMFPPWQRGKAVSTLMTGAGVGAICGPFLVNLAGLTGMDSLASQQALVFAFLCALYFSSVALLGIFLNREPSEYLAAAPPQKPGAATPSPGKLQPVWKSFATMVASQFAMVIVMSITPVHLHHGQHGMQSIAVVIAGHFLGMYGLSFLGGWIADRISRRATILAGGGLLLSACLVGVGFQGYLGTLISLFLLGLAWNFSFISGSILISETARAENRSKLQGLTDMGISMASAAASLLGGVMMSLWGFPFVWTLAALLGLVILGLWISGQGAFAQLETGAVQERATTKVG